MEDLVPFLGEAKDELRTRRFSSRRCAPRGAPLIREYHPDKRAILRVTPCQVDRRSPAGSPIRGPDALTNAGVRRGGGSDALPRHRRKHGDLFTRERPASASVAGQKPGAARAGGRPFPRHGPSPHGSEPAPLYVELPHVGTDSAAAPAVRWRIAYFSTRFNLASGGERELVDGLYASGKFFETLGVTLVLGRVLTDADDQRGGGAAGPVAVVSHGLWKGRFGRI